MGEIRQEIATWTMNSAEKTSSDPIPVQTEMDLVVFLSEKVALECDKRLQGIVMAGISRSTKAVVI